MWKGVGFEGLYGLEMRWKSAGKSIKVIVEMAYSMPLTLRFEQQRRIWNAWNAAMDDYRQTARPSALPSAHRLRGLVNGIGEP